MLPPDTPSTPLTTRTHELQGQSPYVINAALEYSTPEFGTARFLYVTSGERIATLGYYPLANIVEKPRNQLDFVWFKRINVFDQPVTAKLSLENLWNDRFLFKQGDIVENRFRTGVKVGVSFSYDFS